MAGILLFILEYAHEYIGNIMVFSTKVGMRDMLVGLWLTVERQPSAGFVSIGCHDIILVFACFPTSTKARAEFGGCVKLKPEVART